MKAYKTIIAACMLGMFIIPLMADAADGNWKKGRLYYKKVCTSCHVDAVGSPISPSTMTIEEWSAYLDSDIHAKGTNKVSYHVSKDYRESIKATNKAAAKFIKVPDEALMADVRAFCIHGAKDSDNPAGCN